MKKLIPIYALLTALMIIVSASCNDDNSSGNEPNVVSSNTLVTAFSLAANDSVIAGLDSLHFTIDAENRVIYNADSLPKGTKINRLVANITYSTTSTGTIRISGATTMNDTTYTYSGSANDSIDFTGQVFLTVSAADGNTSREYRLKVNVHKIEPDSLYWNELARRDLPGTSSGITAQKTVRQGDRLYCLMQENGGYTLATTESPEIYDWDKTSVEFGFTPVLDSFTATSDALYMLADDNALYTSTDGSSWTATGRSFVALVGAYGNRLLCLSRVDGAYYHSEYPATTAVEIEEGFPVSGFSQCVALGNDWSNTEQVLLLGGRKADGSLTGDVWGFDGENWGQISRLPIPARKNATLLRYYYFMGDYYNKTQYPVWLAIGGTNDKGEATKTVYISYDNGVTWKEGDELLQLPDYMEAFSEAQAFVYESTLNATTRSSSGWQSMPSRRLPSWWTIVGSSATRTSTAVTSWQCPYIYVFGGVDGSGVLLNNVWKGVVNRLTFKPVI